MLRFVHDWILRMLLECWQILSNLGKWVLRYLQRIKRLHAYISEGGSAWDLVFTNSDFTKCKDSMKSTSSYIYLLAQCVVSWKSVKQSLITSSTMVIEFITCYDTSNHGIWLQNFVTGLHIVDDVDWPLNLFCDN